MNGHTLIQTLHRPREPTLLIMLDISTRDKGSNTRGVGFYRMRPFIMNSVTFTKKCDVPHNVLLYEHDGFTLTLRARYSVILLSCYPDIPEYWRPVLR